MFRYKNKTKQNTLILVVGLFLSSCLGVTRAEAASTPSATFYVSPSTSSVSSGTTLSIDLRINVTDDSTHSARARITYSSDKMELANATSTPPFFEAEETSSSGVISLAYGSLSGVSGDHSFATITFKIIADSGNASVIIDPVIDANYHSYVASDSSRTGANILSSIKNGLYTITRTNDSSQTSPTVSGQTSQTSSNQPDTSKTTTNSSNIIGSAMSTKTSGRVSFENRSPGPAATASRTIVAVMMLAVVASTFIAHYFNLHYKIVKLRQIGMRKKHETVADISSRVNGKDRSKDIIADMAARMKSKDHSKETVADIAARIKSKDHSKQTVAEVAARLKLHKKHNPDQAITELAPKLSHKNMNKKRKRPAATSSKR